MSLMTSGGWAHILVPTLRKYFLDHYLPLPSTIPSLFSVEKSSKAKEELLGIVGLDNFSKFTGTVSKTDLIQGYKKEVEHDEWTASVDIQYKLYRDAQYPIFKNMMGRMARAARRTREEDAATVWNHAFDTTYFTGGDSLALCSTAHTNNVDSTTQGNSGTSTLTATNYTATRLLMKKFTDERGKKIGINPNELMVPIDLAETAITITESTLKTGTANNDVNVINKSWKPKVIINDWLTDTNNWFMMDGGLRKDSLFFYNREPLRLFNDSSKSTLVMTFTGYYRTGLGFNDWRWIYGHNV